VNGARGVVVGVVSCVVAAQVVVVVVVVVVRSLPALQLYQLSQQPAHRLPYLHV
jgi:hypothetical protein